MVNKKIKLFTIVGTRPEIIRLSRIIPLLDKYFDHFFIHTGQNYDYELEEIFYKDLDIKKPDIYLQCAGETYAETIGNVISKTDNLLVKEKPDAVLILGDTNSSLSAIPSKRRKIPIFHMEAGNRSFDFRVPEEVNRKIVDHISDVNLTYSKIAKNYLENEGLPPDRTIVTGSPMKEILDFYKDKIESSDILKKLNLKPEKYFLVSAHREENVDSKQKLKQMITMLDDLSKEYKLPIIFSTHPRTKERLKSLKFKMSNKIKFMKPFAFTDYIYLQMNSKCVLSDSGTITEESSILKFPALNLRDAHERPEGFEEAAVIMTGINKDRVFQSLRILESDIQSNFSSMKTVNDYNIDNVSEKVVKIIQSYIDHVNEFVWRK